MKKKHYVNERLTLFNKKKPANQTKKCSAFNNDSLDDGQKKIRAVFA